MIIRLRPGWARAQTVILTLFSITCLLAGPVHGLEYLDNDALGHSLRELSRQHPDLVHLSTLTRSSSQQEIWQIEISSSPEDQRIRQPALLVLAGVEGDDLAGPSIVMSWMRKLINDHPSNTNIQQLLATTTLYIFPRLNPDSARLFFSSPRRALDTNLDPVDDDHDGMKDEDPDEDLNGDGLITSMRVADPSGEYILDPEDDRLLLRADPLKGERGAWRLLTEGMDNDKDGAWNEDGPGGVNFNRNFAYDFRFFAGGSGLHPMSQPETRALANFVIGHPNIAIAFTFGAADNLIQTPKSEAPKRPPATIHPDDIGYYRELGKDWRTQLGLKKELSGTSQPGSFSDWVYFHRGRLSLAARPWTPALQLQMPDKAAPPDPEKPEENQPDAEKTPPETPKEGSSNNKKSEDKRNEEERKFLHWLDKHSPEQFAAWQAFDHPDFPGQEVRIGGYAPFATTAPPADLLEDLANREGAFLTSLLSRLPKLQIRPLEVKALGKEIYDITVTIENTGFLPTSLTQGDVTDEVHPTRLTFDLPPDAFLSGSPRTLLGPIAGSGGAREVRVVIYAPQRGTIELEAISMLGGSVRHSLELPKP